jgi:hypothetical protein
MVLSLRYRVLTNYRIAGYRSFKKWIPARCILYALYVLKCYRDGPITPNLQRAKDFAERLLLAPSEAPRPDEIKSIVTERHRKLCEIVPKTYESYGTVIDHKELWSSYQFKPIPAYSHIEWMCYGWSPVNNFKLLKYVARLKSDDSTFALRLISFGWDEKRATFYQVVRKDME